MTRIAPRSSMMASAVRKTNRLAGTRVPSIRRQPSANAISVAIGTPHPRSEGSWCATRKNSPAGTSIPPSAAIAGTAALRSEFNSPVSNSALISNPTRRKKIAMSRSLTHRMSGLES